MFYHHPVSNVLKPVNRELEKVVIHVSTLARPRNFSSDRCRQRKCSELCISISEIIADTDYDHFVMPPTNPNSYNSVNMDFI